MRQFGVWWFGKLCLVAAACLAAGSFSLQSYRASRHTSLTAAWTWLLLAEFAVLFLSFTDFLAGAWPGKTADYGWCFASILLLCPPIAVLGARRPGATVWTWFILIPLVIVLSWPIWTLVLQGAELRGLALETPTVLGFGLVLLMGAGNFLGTRFAISALWYALGTYGLFLSCSGWNIVPATALTEFRMLSILGLTFAAAGTCWKTATPTVRHPANRIWDDFRNSFGIVWALRLVERVNAYAAQEHWTIRMTLDGFPESPDGTLTSDEAEVSAACRWLFRRFVEPEWINQRLGSDSATQPIARNDQETTAS